MKCNAIFVQISIQILLTSVFAAGLINDSIIDTACHNDTDCKEFVMNGAANSTCFNRQCICKDSDFKTIECLPQKKGLANVIGGKCPCTSIKWSTCVDGFCMCKRDFTSSKDNRTCIPKQVSIGNHCENDVQCSKLTTFSSCTNHTCSCKVDHTFYNGTCQSLVDIGKECDSDDKCLVIPNTLCVSQQCFCVPGYVAKFDRSACLPNADYNDGCLESAQCQHKLGGGGVCEKGRCICAEDFVKVSINIQNETKTMCENRIVIGESCVYDSDCFQSRYNTTEQTMYCYLKECHCSQDYEEDRFERFCIKKKLIQRENTWFDSILTKVSSAFGSSGSRSNFSYNWVILFILTITLLTFEIFC
ncbi:hypothetical protein Bhyg_13974 [Pseudolycoriella hygida]|uniref:EB domain-containing protein n=1 Tax=Pseudolycoriella hygida TaxID=35572 RepID=A0A9Q0MR39_9DIPT|nr:hypothetical protein Bhyg_13974 [Pseudolycoriella hygida]